MVEWLWTLRESSEISRLFAEKIRRQVAGPNIQAHEKIYQCLSRRDAAGARAAMQEHIAQVTEAYILLIAD
jgi:GntR family transcriptional repressor for pyruvate dehydrogenase complex